MTSFWRFFLDRRRFQLRQAFDLLGFTAAVACLLVKPGQRVPSFVLDTAWIDYWAGGFVSLLTVLFTSRSVFSQARRWLSPERTVGIDTIGALTDAEREAARQIQRLQTASFAIGEYTWRFAKSHELSHFRKWSELDSAIGRQKMDRESLYRNWYSSEPRAFSFLLHYGQPVGGIIILPLNKCGVAILDQDGIDARNLRAPHLGYGNGDFLADTMVAARDDPTSLRRGYYFIALLAEHLKTFLSTLDHGTIWFEPDHPLFQALAHTPLCRSRGSSHSDSGTWSFDLDDPRLSKVTLKRG